MAVPAREQVECQQEDSFPLSADAAGRGGRHGTSTTAGFGLLEAGFDVRLTDTLHLLIEGTNLTDATDAHDEGDPEAGRTDGATLIWQPGKEQQ